MNGIGILPRTEQTIDSLSISILTPEETDKPKKRKCPITVL